MTMKNKEIEEKINEVIENMTDKDLIMQSIRMLIHADLMKIIKGERSNYIDNKILEIIDSVDMLEKIMYENKPIIQMGELKKELQRLSDLIDQVNAKVESMRIEKMMKEKKDFNWGTKPVFEKR